MMLGWIGAFVMGLALGSIPFGLILTRAAGLGDIRAIGSGSIGATNVLRTGRKGLAAATLLLDGGKGAASVLMAGYLFGHDGAWLAGLGAVVGHCFSIWLKFRGGKGVATGLGVLLAAIWPIGIAGCAIWLIMAALARMSSLASLTATVATPILIWFWGDRFGAGIALLVSALIVQRHHANIARLLAGTEPRIGAGK